MPLISWRISFTVFAAVVTGAHGTWRERGLGEPDDSNLMRPSTRYNLAGTFCEGLDVPIFFGGLAGTSVKAVSEAWALNMEQDTWELAVLSSTSLIPKPRAGHTLTTLTDRSEFCDVLLYGGSEVFETKQIAMVGRFRRTPYMEVTWSYVNSTELEPIALHTAVTSLTATYDRNKTKPEHFHIYVYGRKINTVAPSQHFERLELIPSEDIQVKLSYRLDVSSNFKTAQNSGGPAASWMGASAAIGATLFFYGGLSFDDVVEGRTVSTNDLWLYNTIKGTWSNPTTVAGKDQQFKRHGHQLVAFQNHIFLFGGARQYFQTNAANSLRYVYFFDRVLVSSPLESNRRDLCVNSNSDPADLNETWCEQLMVGDEKQRPDCRNLFSAVRRKDTMLIFGGTTDTSCSVWPGPYRNDVWELNLTEALQGTFTHAEEAIGPEFSALISSLYFFVGLLSITFLLFCIQFARARPIGEETYVWGNVMEARSRGASISKIEMLPEVTFRSSSSAEDECCPICLTEFEDSEKLIALPCNHIYHRGCITEWLVKNDSCPLCKRSILPITSPLIKSAGASRANRAIEVPTYQESGANYSPTPSSILPTLTVSAIRSNPEYDLYERSGRFSSSPSHQGRHGETRNTQASDLPQSSEDLQLHVV